MEETCRSWGCSLGQGVKITMAIGIVNPSHYIVKRHKIGILWDGFEGDIKLRFKWDDAIKWIEDDIADMTAKWPELGVARKVYFDKTDDPSELPVIKWVLGYDEFRVEYDLMYRVNNDD